MSSSQPDPPAPLVGTPPTPAGAVPPMEAHAPWREQLRRRIRSLDALIQHVPGSRVSPEMREAARRFPMAITPYYASLIRRADDTDPIFRQCVPHPGELHNPDWLREDPLEETACSPVPGLIHRYPDRALILAHTACAVYCRHCTRKRISAQPESAASGTDWDACVNYLTTHPAIDDVLISGGDPLLLSDATLATLLSRIRAVPSVRVIRIATRTPVTLPMRLTPRLVRMLARQKPLFVNTHFNHPVELTPTALAATARLTDAGIPVGNQTVLLRGVNDTPDTIETLCRMLYHNRIRPYYLFQCDLVGGIEPFRTPLATGLNMMKHLRGRLSGPAIPHFAVDTPGHGGKIELVPPAIRGTTPGGTLLENSLGEIIRYPDPVSHNDDTARHTTVSPA